MPVKNYNKKYLFYSLLSLLSVSSLLSLLFINKIDKINGIPVLKLLKSMNSSKIINNNINSNNINSTINSNKINDTNNDETIKTKLNNNYTNEIERINTTEGLDKNYTINGTINGTIVKQSVIYDMSINNFIGEVIIYYNTTYHKHHYCKINIIISTQVNLLYISEYMYYYYNFDKNINLICNDYDCVESFNYNRNIEKNKYYKCNILNNIQIKDEL